MSRQAPGPFARFAGLHALVDDAMCWGCDPVEQARLLCEGAPQVVQLRAKSATDRQTLAWAREIRALTRECGALFVVNDRFDLALAAEADAVHLGQDDLPPACIPVSVRRRLAVGRSTHTPQQARAACEEEVDYVAFGPVFGTTSKDSRYPSRGLDALEEVAALVGARPLIAIGGIDASNASAVALAGADGIAVISAIATATDRAAATRQLVQSLRARGARAEAPRGHQRGGEL